MELGKVKGRVGKWLFWLTNPTPDPTQLHLRYLHYSENDLFKNYLDKSDSKSTIEISYEYFLQSSLQYPHAV